MPKDLCCHLAAKLELQYVPPYSVRTGRLQFGVGFPGIRVVLKYVAAIPEKICGKMNREDKTFERVCSPFILDRLQQMINMQGLQTRS